VTKQELKDLVEELTDMPGASTIMGLLLPLRNIALNNLREDETPQHRAENALRDAGAGKLLDPLDDE
jgi:hypothetical protein